MPPKRKSDAKSSAEGPTEPATTTTKKAKSGKLSIGDNVSSLSVTLTTNDDKQVTLSELSKDKGIIVFSYPRANTPGCTKQACGFRDNYKPITDAGYDIYGISFDKPKSQTNWKNKYDLPYSLLTDADGDVLKAFGAFKQPKNVIRSHFIVAKGGEVLDIRNQISPADSFNEALAFAKEHVQNAK